VEPRNQTENQSLSALRHDSPLPVSGDATRNIADCWNQIGVAGDGTCAELPRVVHCRNCPVYSAAGTMLLDRVPPPDYRRDLTEHFSRDKKRPTQGRHSVVIFRLGTEWLALPTGTFQEISERRTIHSLPDRRHGVLLGLINIRGELLLCVSLARLLGINVSEIAERPPFLHNRLVLAEWQGDVFIFPVDEIREIHRYQSEELKPIPATAGKPSFAAGLLAWQDKMVGCLDAELLFSTLNRNLK
jgi:chemotaxis-related protein WspD